MNILQELYYGNIGEVNRKRNPKFIANINKELALYNDICKLLNKEQKELFEKFLDLCGENHANELEDTYIQGFKTGLLIAIESTKIEL